MSRKAAIAAVMASLVFAAPSLAQQGGGAWTMGPEMMGGDGPGMMMGRGYGMMGGMGMMSQYPDGTVAFLKTELGITSAQEKVWAPFAKAVRDAAAANARGWGMGRGRMMRGAGQMGPGMMQGQQRGPGMMQGRQTGPGAMQNYQAWQPQPLPQALDQDVDQAQSQLDSLKALRDAAKPLYAKLTDDQKAKADRLLGFGMMY